MPVNAIVDQLLQQARIKAEAIGGCDPQWLKGSEALTFKTVEGRPRPESQKLPELLLLHGLLGALSNWDGVFPCFEDFSRPIALHLPLLTAHRSEVKIKALALYSWYFIKSRKLDPISLCGNSLGGHVALRLYFAAPEVVDCLVLTGTSGLYEHSVDTLPVRPDREFIREHMGRVFSRQEFITDQAIEEIHAILNNRMSVLNLIHAARSAKKDNLLTLLKEIKVPTLLLWGEDDQVTTMDVAETFHKHIPNSELVTIKNCGHAPMIEYPEWFADQTKRFLAKHSRYYKNG